MISLHPSLFVIEHDRWLLAADLLNRRCKQACRVKLAMVIHFAAVLFIQLLVCSVSHAAPSSPSCGSAEAALRAQQLRTAQLPSCAQLSDAIVLRWGIKGDVITFGLQAQLPPDTAYLGIGLSELGSMKGADIALFNTTASGKWTLVDAYAVGTAKPIADKLQNSKLLGIMQASNSLVAAWQRRLAPCDQQDLPIGSVPLHVIWAHGSSWGYHGSANRGSRLVSFLPEQQQPEPAVTAKQAVKGKKPQQQQQKLYSISSENGSSKSTPAVAGAQSLSSSAVKVMELTYPVSIPDQTTNYFVKYFKLPDNKKYHIIKYEVVANSPLLHHGVAYSCDATKAAAVRKLPSMGPYDRFKHDMLCEQFYMLVGPTNTSGYTAPPNAGLPMGTPNTQYMSLELHYNNPDNLVGQKDKGSGLRVYYTDKLRPHDIGLITLNQPVLNIPPGLPTVKSNVSVCPSSCTSRLNRPVTLLDGFFHMHGLGKSIITRRFRDGQELAPLAQLHADDYEFQGNTPIGPESRTLMPGDALTLQCTFDSTSRKQITKSGPATQDEMCFHWISYYPAQEDMGLCHSFGDRPIAVCGPSMPFDLRHALLNRTAAAATVVPLMSEGKLMPAIDPAGRSKLFKEICSSEPVA